MPDTSNTEPPRESSRAGAHTSPPVVWTPEDAANFLSTAIKEAQRPLSQALKRQGVPYWVFGLVLLVMLSSTVLCWLYLDQLLQKSLHDNSRLAMDLRRAHTKYEDLLVKRNLGMQELQAKYGRAVEATLKLQGEQARIKGEIAAARSAAAASQQEAQKIRVKLDKADAGFKDRLRMLQADYEKALLRASKQSGQSKELEAQLEELQHYKETTGSQLTALHNKLTASDKRGKLLQTQLDGLQQERDALRKQLDASQALLRSLRGKDGQK